MMPEMRGVDWGWLGGQGLTDGVAPRRRGRGGVPHSRGARDGGDETGGGLERAIHTEVACGGSVIVRRVVVGSGAEVVRCRGKEKGGKLHSVVHSTYSRVRRWTPAARWRKQRVENDGGQCSLALGAQSGRRRFDSGADRRAPHGLIFFQIFQNQFNFVNSKYIPCIALKIPKFCMMLDWKIMHNFLNSYDLKFPREIKLKILEQI
jgi:hypothetical protein